VYHGDLAAAEPDPSIGAERALAGAALFYSSAALLAYAVLFLIAAHLFVLAYEEPTVTRLFGPDSQAYRTRVRRWLPRL
jgi:protein-S-isoprenylcysteine O-methyltransferase Ste14